MKTTKLYVDWDNRKILSEAAYLKELDKRTKQKFSDQEEFFDVWFVYSNHTPHELLNMTDEEKTALSEEFYDYCITLAEEAFKDNYEEITMPL